MFLCSICSQLFGRGSERLCATKCGHVYHADCIYEWLETSTSCPDCREFCSNEEVIVIYMPLLSVVPIEQMDEVKRLNDIHCKGNEIIQVIGSKIKEKISSNPESHKFLKDIYDDVQNLKDVYCLIEGVVTTLNDIGARGNEIFERHAAMKDDENALKNLSEYSAKLQRDLDCCVNNYRRIQSESYENNLANITLRCENNTLECNMKMLNGKVHYLNSCVELLKNEIDEKAKTLKDEIDSKRIMAIELTEMNDKNTELTYKLETSEASMMPVFSTIRRLHSIIGEKSELLTLYTNRIQDLKFTISEMEKKIQSMKYELNWKCEQKDGIILDQRKRLCYLINSCSELNEKINDYERKINFYETVLRGVAERKNEAANASKIPSIFIPNINNGHKRDSGQWSPNGNQQH